MEVWNGVRIYVEAHFERKIERDRKGMIWDELTGGRSDCPDLIHGQLMDLIEGLPLSARSRELLRLRLEGWSLRESAEILGISRQCLERLWSRTLRKLPPTLEGMEAMLDNGQVPHYGWQEVYLESMRMR
jgi:DNA-binding CsgD family transcriptional regulator